MQKFFRAPLIIIGLTIAFLFFLFGYFWGNYYRQESFYVTLEKNPPPEASANGYSYGADKEKEEDVINGKININVADAEELCRLKGIGPVLAERIIVYREENGGFYHAFELMNVSGIGKALYESIKKEITVG